MLAHSLSVFSLGEFMSNPFERLLFAGGVQIAVCGRPERQTDAVASA
jgi:hypothetical protein